MNRKYLIPALLIAIALSAQAQNRYFTKTGAINFTAGTPLEDIDAVNKSVTSVFDVITGQIEFAVLIRGFEFRRALMQEHFNENYMESEKYPKSTFKGKFTNVSSVNFKTDGVYVVSVKGTLDIHNVKKEVEVPATIKIAGGVISASAVFKVQTVDFKIEIPGAVREKIAPTVEIHVACDYKAMK